jgi:hypothetical protein
MSIADNYLISWLADLMKLGKNIMQLECVAFALISFFSDTKWRSKTNLKYGHHIMQYLVTLCRFGTKSLIFCYVKLNNLMALVRNMFPL